MRGVFERPKGSGVWWINYYDADGVRHREKIGRQSVAESAYVQRRMEIRDGRFAAPRSASQFTFAELADERMAAKKPFLSRRSYETDAWRLEPLKRVLGSVPARAMTPQRIAEAFQELRSHAEAEGRLCTDSTLNRYRTLLQSIFTVGMANGRASLNPAKKVPKRKEPPGRIRFLSNDEERRLLRVVRQRWPESVAEVELALQTGLRRNVEQFNLRWEDVDLEFKILTVVGKGNKRRHIPINSVAEKALRKLHRISNGSPWVSPGRRKEKQLADRRSWFDVAAAEARIAGVTWHTLRHTFVSRLVMSGVDLRTVQQLAGHSSITTTMRYAHLSDAHVVSAVEKLAGWHQDGTRRKRARRKILQMPSFQ